MALVAFLIFGAVETWYATGFDHMSAFIRQIGGGTFSGCAGIPGCETGFVVKGWAAAAVSVTGFNKIIILLVISNESKLNNLGVLLLLLLVLLGRFVCDLPEEGQVESLFLSSVSVFSFRFMISSVLLPTTNSTQFFQLTTETCHSTVI